MRARRCGLALIVVVGVLGVLAVLAVAFVTMAQLERKASQQRVNAAKAYLLARSGIEDALARLAMGQDPAYGGEDWDNSGTLNGFEGGQEIYRPGTLDTASCPVRHALRSSFFARDPGSLGADGKAAPKRQGVEGRERGYSGSLSADLVLEGNTYALKVSQEGGFFLNGGDPTAASDVGYNAVLRRILGTLAEALDRPNWIASDDGLPVDETDGWKLIDLRPPSGWESFEQIRDVAFAADTPAVWQLKLDTLREYLTLKAWVDRSVIVPNATAAMEGKNYGGWGLIRMDRPVGSFGTHAPDLERIGGKVVGRAPVDFAWARTRKPALIALMAGLKGLYLNEGIQIDRGARAVGTLRSAEIVNTWGFADDCEILAYCFQTWTSQIETWPQFNDFCDAIPLSGTTDVRQAKRDILKANFNPNSDLNKFNPNLSLWKSVDKSDLLAYSTEFSLFPVKGNELESTGRVLGRNGRLLASRTLRASVAPPSVVRLSTQRDFVCQGLGDPTLQGDETGVRLPGSAAFVRLSQGLSKTWGHTLPGLSPSGASLQSYPEPCVNPGSGLSMSPADYDGNIQLATVETALNEWYWAPANTKDMKMLARFDDGFDLDVADADPASQPQGQLVTTAELGNGLMHASRPVTLYPDGVDSGWGIPAWKDLGNSDGYHGVMSFWLKPAYRLIAQSLSSGYNRAFVDRTNIGPDPWEVQLFVLGECRNYVSPGIFMLLETNSIGEANVEHHFDPPAPTTPNLWHLVTAFWDFKSPTKDDTGELILNDGAGVLTGSDSHYGATTNMWAMASDITQDDNGSPHVLALGAGATCGAGNTGDVLSGGADATIDEFALYDFGGASGGSPADLWTLATPGILAQVRYREGRYYKGAVYNPPGAGPVADEAASFVMPPIRLPKASSPRNITWTWLLPQGFSSSDYYAEVELLDPSGAAYLDGNAVRSRSSLGLGWTADRQSWKVDRSLSGSFRTRVVFHGKTPADLNLPLLDSPVLDDLTFLYEPQGGCRISGWEEAQ